MKSIKYCIWLLIIFGLMACGGGGNDEQSSDEPAVRELQVGATQDNFIATEGEVDTYHLRATETNRFLLVNCKENDSGSGVDLLVTVFEEVNGERHRIFGKHKTNNAVTRADFDLWIYIDRPKDLYITVRDLMDDDFSTSIAYHLTVSFQDSAEGNHDFSNAQVLTLGAGNAVRDAIDDIGEVDCFTFTTASDGVYGLNVDHLKPAAGSPVQLAVSLYDHNGNRIQRLVDPNHVILAYLTQSSGPYYVIVEDNASMHADSGAPYNISVEAVTVDEAQVDDEAETAQTLSADAQDTFAATGAVSYGCSSISPGNGADADWYRMTIGAAGGGTSYHQVQLQIDGGENVDSTALLRYVVYNSAMEPVTSKDFQYTGEAFQNQFRVQDGEYFLFVTAASPSRLSEGSPYRVQLQLMNLNDDAEAADDNTINTAISLDPPNDNPGTGMISYPGDVDWYKLQVDTTTAQVVSVELNTTAPSPVDYQLSIWRSDGTVMEKKVSDLDGSDVPTQLKTSILLPADGENQSTYYFKVCDGQNNEGSSVPYTITAAAASVGATPPSIAATSGQTLRYFSETGVEPNGLADVELEIFSTLQPHFKANTTWLDFRDDATPGISKVQNADGTTIITFPWISGYIDYDGDRDFFQLDFHKLGDGAETSWYYDVQIRLVVPSPGSPVEYVWKLYRDSYHDGTVNGIIMDDPTADDGYKACNGDTTLTTGALDLTTPAPGTDETFWIGSEWGGETDAKFYLAISDFNYLKIPETAESGNPDSAADNPNADNDWGYAVPYYFTLTLTYHPVCSSPTDTAAGCAQ